MCFLRFQTSNALFERIGFKTVVISWKRLKFVFKIAISSHFRSSRFIHDISYLFKMNIPFTSKFSFFPFHDTTIFVNLFDCMPVNIILSLKIAEIRLDT